MTTSSSNPQLLPVCPKKPQKGDIETDDEPTGQLTLNNTGLRFRAKIGVVLLRGGLIGGVVISLLVALFMSTTPIDGITPRIPWYLYWFVFLTGGLCLILFTVLFYSGIVITSIKIFTSKQNIREGINKVTREKNIMTIYSLIVANWALSLFPQMILFPFYGGLVLSGTSSFALPLNIGEKNDSFILIAIIQDILENGDIGSELGRIIRIISLGILIYSVCYLIWKTITIIPNRKEIEMKEKINSRGIIFELSISIVIIFLLVFEILIPVMEFVNPSGLNIPGWSLFLLDYFIATLFTIVILIFLITGNFNTQYFIIGNTNNIKVRFLLGIIIPSSFFGLTLLLI